MQLQYHQNVRLKLMAYNRSTSYYVYKITLVSVNHVLFMPYDVSSKDIYFKCMAKCILYCQQCRQISELSCVNICGRNDTVSEICFKNITRGKGRKDGAGAHQQLWRSGEGYMGFITLFSLLPCLNFSK